MFNLAQSRGKQDSPKAKYKALHSMRMQNRESALQEDSRTTALMMIQEDLDAPRDAMAKRMGQDAYWQYIRENDPGYMKEVMHLTKDIVMELRRFHKQTGKWPPNVIPVSPPPKQEGGPGGGAPGGAPGGGGPPGAGLGGLFGASTIRLRKYADLTTLPPEECVDSSDIGSLLLTATAKKAHPAAREIALGRLVEIACSEPSLCKDFGLVAADAETIARAASSFKVNKKLIERLGKMLGLAGADDAEVVESFVSGDDDDRKIVSRLVAAQGRDSIMSAAPEMCLVGDWLNPEFFGRLDVKDGAARKVIAKVLLAWAEGNHRIPEDILTRKASEAIDSGDKGILLMSLNGPEGLRCKALGRLVQDEEMAPERAFSIAQTCSQCPVHAAGCKAMARMSTDPGLAKAAFLRARMAEERAAPAANKR